MNENVRNCSQIIGSGQQSGHKRNISRTMSVENENPIQELPTGEMEEETSGFLEEENSGAVKKLTISIENLQFLQENILNDFFLNFMTIVKLVLNVL